MPNYPKTFKVPTLEKQLVEVPCKLMTLELPHWGERVFALHPDLNGDDGLTYLSDYASGRRIGCLTPIKEEQHDIGVQIKDRTAALTLLMRKINSYGLGRVMDEITDATMVNGGG